MFEKVNVGRIIKDHVSTWRNYATGRSRPYDYLLFLGIPGLAAWLWLGFGGIKPMLWLNLIVILNMWFTAMMIVLSWLDDRLKIDTLDYDDLSVKTARRYDLLNEATANVMFGMVMAVSSLVVTLCLGVWQVGWLAFVSYWSCGVLFLTLLMIAKRIYSLMMGKNHKR